MSMVVGRTDHVAIAAEDVEGMVAWYGRVLGFRVMARNAPPAGQRAAYLIGPPPGETVRQGSMIEVMPHNGEARRGRVCHDPGLSHIAFYVADFDAALAHLQGQKVEFLGEVGEALGGGRLVSFADCEGNMLQIVERK